MNVTFICSDCTRPVRTAVEEGSASLTCPHCGQGHPIPPGALAEGEIRRCLVCPSTELFVRKDFPQWLGVAIVAVGVVTSSIAWGYQRVALTFGILLATALLDVALYVIVGDVLRCYRCHAEYRGGQVTREHDSFHLDTHERHRQLAARVARDQRSRD